MIQKQTNIHPIFQYIEDKGNLIKKLKNETTIEFNLKTKNNNIINYQYPEIKEELEKNLIVNENKINEKKKMLKLLSNDISGNERSNQ